MTPTTISPTTIPPGPAGPSRTPPVATADGSTADGSTADGSTADGGRRTTPGGASGNLGAELRESLLLLLFAAGTTLGLTTAAQAALAALA